MEQHADTEHAEVHRADDEIIYEIPHGHGSHQSAATRVPVDALAGIHGLALLVGKHDPQGQGVDGDALNERDNMNVPVELGALVQLRVVTGEEDRGEAWRQHRVDELVA